MSHVRCTAHIVVHFAVARHLIKWDLAGKEQQLFEGWGTSLCWFANVAGGFPEPQRNYVADLLFDPQKGLGLQICRYNIGGSGWGTLDVPNFRYGANIERFACLAVCVRMRLCSASSMHDCCTKFSHWNQAGCH